MILSTLDINRMNKTALYYLFISLFCILFGAVYELFSHEVYSYFMLYAFVIPLGGGALPFFYNGLFRSAYTEQSFSEFVSFRHRCFDDRMSVSRRAGDLWNDKSPCIGLLGTWDIVSGDGRFDRSLVPAEM